MKLIIKIFLGFLFILIIAATGFSLWFNPNDYKNDITQLFHEKTGRTLSIPGDISLSFFPWIGLELGQIEVSNAAGFKDKAIAQMTRLQVRTKLWPLLKQQLEADTLVIEGLSVNLEKNKNGLTNWDDFLTTQKKPAKKPSTATGTASANNTLAALAINGIELKNAQFNWHDQQQKQKLTLNNIDLSIGKLMPDTAIPVQLSFHLKNNELDTQVSFNSKITFASDLKLFSLQDTALHSKLQLTELKKTLEPDFSSPLIKIDLNKQAVTLSKLLLTMDQTHIKGDADIKLNNAASELNINIDNINLDRYLSAPTEKPTTEKQTAKRKNNTDDAVLIPVALLGSVNLNAKITIDALDIKNTHWKNIKIATRANNGNIKINPMSLQGYGSSINSQVNILAKNNTATIAAELAIKDLMAGKLLNDYTGKDKLTGKTSVNAKINTSGVKLSSLKQNMNGNFNLALLDGAIKGFDIHHQGKVLEAKLKGKAVPATPVPEETKIASLTASGSIKNGVIHNNDLRAATPLSRIAGKGTVNLATEKLDYIASVKFTASTAIKDDISYEQMNALPLDILIKGSFNDPQVNVDFQKILQQAVGKELKKHENKIKEDLNKEIQKKLGNELNKLLKF